MLGMEKPVHIFQLGASVEEMVNNGSCCGCWCSRKNEKIGRFRNKILTLNLTD
jgi:hypothetical protein